MPTMLLVASHATKQANSFISFFKAAALAGRRSGGVEKRIIAQSSASVRIVLATIRIYVRIVAYVHIYYYSSTSATVRVCVYSQLDSY